MSRSNMGGAVAKQTVKLLKESEDGVELTLR